MTKNAMRQVQNGKSKMRDRLLRGVAWPWCGEGIPDTENCTEESMCSGHNEKLSVVANHLGQKGRIWQLWLGSDYERSQMSNWEDWTLSSKGMGIHQRLLSRKIAWLDWNFRKITLAEKWSVNKNGERQEASRGLGVKFLSLHFPVTLG